MKEVGGKWKENKMNSPFSSNVLFQDIRIIETRVV